MPHVRIATLASCENTIARLKMDTKLEDSLMPNAIIYYFNQLG